MSGWCEDWGGNGVVCRGAQEATWKSAVAGSPPATMLSGGNAARGTGKAGIIPEIQTQRPPKTLRALSHPRLQRPALPGQAVLINAFSQPYPFPASRYTVVTL